MVRRRGDTDVPRPDPGAPAARWRRGTPDRGTPDRGTSARGRTPRRTAREPATPDRSGADRPGRDRRGVPRPGSVPPVRAARTAGASARDRAARPTRDRPPPDRPPLDRAARWALWRRRLRITAVIASVLVLAGTGGAWQLYRDVTAGITTTDVTSGDGGDQFVLLVGVDSRTDAQGRPLPPELLRELNAEPSAVLNADTIILLHVPQSGGRATAFSIPRDAYVDIPGYRSDKINAALPAVSLLTAERLVDDGAESDRVAAESARAGRRALVGAVERLTGVTVDHYAEVNLLGFYELTRAVGGVEVCLNAAVDEPLSGARLPAGPQTISGRDALAFVRQRHDLPEGDLSRIRRQQVFLAAVADKLLSAGTLTDPESLRALVGVAQRSLVIDQGWDLLAFARQATDLAAGNLEFVTIPTRGTATNGRGSVVQVDLGEVRDFVAARTAERPAPEPEPAAAAAPQPEPLPADLEARRYVAHVRNASTTAGLAAAVADHLAGHGFVRGSVGNADGADTGAPASVVRHRDSPDAAAAVAANLGGLAVERDGTVPSGHLVVLLGPGAVPAVAAAAAPEPPPPAPDGTITAAGVPCID